jgi:ribose 5-phosphate isomerase A
MEGPPFPSNREEKGVFSSPRTRRKYMYARLEMDQVEAKQLVARAALALLPDEGVVGLGSGSTAKLFIDGVGELVRSGRKLRGVPTSEESRRQAAALGIDLLPDDGPWDIDVCVDGADEVSAALDLIKGGGGCPTREKIVNQAARRNVIVVDESKLSEQLGQKWAVPIEVLAFAHRATARALERLGKVKLRLRDGSPWITDSGNYIYDLAAGVLADPGALEAELGRTPGVVETGLFVGRADVVLVAGGNGVRRLERSPRR